MADGDLRRKRGVFSYVPPHEASEMGKVVEVEEKDVADCLLLSSGIIVL